MRTTAAWLGCAGVIATLIACGGDNRPAVIVESRADSLLPELPQTQFRVDTLVRGLEVPWGLAYAPDGRLFITERPGRVRVWSPGDTVPSLWAELTVHAHEPGVGPESGLMGIALAPDFAESRHVYVMATVRRRGEPGFFGKVIRRLQTAVRPLAALPFESRIVRFTEVDGRGTDPTVIVDGIPANHYHAGGALAFGPDGLLYVGVGDAIVSDEAPNPRALVGKILRYTRTGEPAADNPVPGSAVWASGLRNVQGLSWLPDGTLLGIEHGPSGMSHEGGRGGRDELNVLVLGRDYGWPTIAGWDDPSVGESPIWVWQAGIAPAGFAVYSGGFEPWHGSVLVGGLRGHLERLALANDAGVVRVIGSETIIRGAYGRIRNVTVTPDGGVVFTTSNRDARGLGRPNDDLVVRLTLLQ